VHAGAAVTAAQGQALHARRDPAVAKHGAGRRARACASRMATLPAAAQRTLTSTSSAKPQARDTARACRKPLPCLRSCPHVTAAAISQMRPSGLAGCHHETATVHPP